MRKTKSGIDRGVVKKEFPERVIQMNDRILVNLLKLDKRGKIFAVSH